MGSTARRRHERRGVGGMAEFGADTHEEDGADQRTQCVSGRREGIARGTTRRAGPPARPMRGSEARPRGGRPSGMGCSGQNQEKGRIKSFSIF